MNKFFQPYILGLIREELRKVKEANKAPVVASKLAIIDIIQKDIDEAINALEADGVITVARNINHVPLYNIKESKQDIYGNSSRTTSGTYRQIHGQADL